MAALTADINISTDGDITITPVKADAADVFYQGAICWADLDASGDAIVGSIAAGDRVLGVCMKYVNAADGDLIPILVGGCIWFPAITGIDATDVGSLITFDAGTLTDNIDDADSSAALTLAANDAAVGKLIRYDSSLGCLVQIGNMTGLIYAGAAGSGWK